MSDASPEPVDAAAVWAAVSRNDVEFLRSAIVWIALDADDYEAARPLCVALSSHDDEFVRGNAVLGFGHLARIFGRVQRDDLDIVHAALLDASEHVRGHAHSAIDDIDMFIGTEFKRRELTAGPWYGADVGQAIRAVFVGWLGRAWRGDGCRNARLRDALVAALFAKVPPVSERNVERGITTCPVCEQTVYVTRDGGFFGGVSDEEERRACRAAMARGAWNILCHSELWVQIRPGEYYVSPMLIIHFIDAHGYAPPDEYVAAVLGSKT